MSDGFAARIAAREAWKRVEGKYPYEDDGLTTDQRLQDMDLQEIVNLRAELAGLKAAIEALDKRMHDDETFQTVTEGDEKIIKFYYIPCGPWHRILGMVRGGGYEPPVRWEGYR